MICSVCKKETNELYEVLLTCDGDFACDKVCEQIWKDERDRFLNVVIHDDDLFNKWMTG